jgi:hypothetical protein
MGHYANWFWAALLGPVAWRVYELVVSGDRRGDKTLWTPPRRYSISELARSVAAGRDGAANRDQIRGRYRIVDGRRVWQPGAFDRLTAEGLARIEWHDGTGPGSSVLPGPGSSVLPGPISPSPSWQPWFPAGGESECQAGGHGAGVTHSGLRGGESRRVYRLSVVTSLPLLTPQQVARLTAEQQVEHERYLADRGIDLFAWEQIGAPTLAAGGTTLPAAGGTTLPPESRTTLSAPARSPAPARESLAAAGQDLAVAAEYLAAAGRDLAAVGGSLPVAAESLPAAGESPPASQSPLPAERDPLPAAQDWLPPEHDWLPERHRLPPVRDWLPEHDWPPPEQDWRSPIRDWLLPEHELASLGQQYVPPAQQFVPPALDLVPPSQQLDEIVITGAYASVTAACATVDGRRCSFFLAL